jgi:hypothetical protein
MDFEEKPFAGERVVNRQGNRGHRGQPAALAISLDSELRKGRRCFDMVGEIRSDANVRAFRVE